MSLSGAPRTRMEAHEMISQSACGAALLRVPRSTQTALDAAWKENNVSSLPYAVAIRNKHLRAEG